MLLPVPSNVGLSRVNSKRRFSSGRTSLTKDGNFVGLDKLKGRIQKTEM